ncbi:Histidine kinase [Chitinophaga sp. YR573]|uniref:sensor histidine kinase n=1 Tax=Chitinophaga sp. YR573 TaxID=1881040 RepID=UPI0008C4A6F7|nr:histidine kinase [Chitinophaga sp. YR573]SEV94509.1 Histidine kinase [Chitinophaga sp. YR573]
MAKQLLTDKLFRRTFIGTAYVFLVVHAAVLLYWYKLGNGLAWTDSAVHIILLALSARATSFGLAYYRPARGKYTFLLTYTVAQTALWLFISTSMMRCYFPGEQAYLEWAHEALPARFVIGWLVICFVAFRSLWWHDMEAQREELLRKDTAERLAREAELYKLRQQLQPHFLFNSLNSINALIMLRPQQAREMVLKLSDFLRGTLKREDQDWIALPDELQYLQWYLDIEKVRFGHRLSTNVTATDATADLKIPPMLLQPVVENAIKYGLYDTTDAITITIEAWVQDELLYVQVQNPFDSDLQQPQTGTGFGLTSIRRRLYLLFARHDLLETTAKENIYTTLIKVPQLYDKSDNN